MRKQTIDEIFSRFAEREPEPQTELSFTNHFTLLVAVVLSAQSTDVGVNKATKDLFVQYDTPEAMLELGEEGLKSYIKTIGLYHSKAKNVMGLCKQLIEKHGGEVPEDRDALEALPGVGRKTANVVLNCAFGHPTMAVDTHVQRVSNRIGLVKSTTPKQTETQLLKNIPDQWLNHAHHWLILHGRYTCKARKPVCYNCMIADLCKYKDKTPPPEK